MTVTDALGAETKHLPEHDADHPEMDHAGGKHMVGMVLGITVAGDRHSAAATGSTRKLQLFVRERPARAALSAGFGYQL
jgi:hypothetical protein